MLSTSPLLKCPCVSPMIPFVSLWLPVYPYDSLCVSLWLLSFHVSHYDSPVSLYIPMTPQSPQSRCVSSVSMCLPMNLQSPQSRCVSLCLLSFHVSHYDSPVSLYIPMTPQSPQSRCVSSVSMCLTMTPQSPCISLWLPSLPSLAVSPCVSSVSMCLPVTPQSPYVSPTTWDSPICVCSVIIPHRIL